MSENVHYKGKLKPTGLTPEQFMIEEHGEECVMPSYYDDLNEWLTDTWREVAVIIDGLVFKVDQTSVVETQEIFTATKNADGSYDFELAYYDGGCGFNEAIAEAMKAPKADFARKDAEILELRGALEELFKDIGVVHALNLNNNVGGSTRRALIKAKAALASKQGEQT